jgi:hypothetical protein
VLQSCKILLEVVAGSYIETNATSLNDANEGIGVKVEEGTDLDIKEEISVLKFEEAIDLDVKEDKIPVYKTISTIKAEQDGVTHMSVCLSIIRCISPVPCNAYCLLSLPALSV